MAGNLRDALATLDAQAATLAARRETFGRAWAELRAAYGDHGAEVLEDGVARATATLDAVLAGVAALRPLLVARIEVDPRDGA